MLPVKFKRSAPFAALLTAGGLFGLFAAVLTVAAPPLGFLGRLLFLLGVFMALCSLLFLPRQSAATRRVTAATKRITAFIFLFLSLSFLLIEGLILAHAGGDQNPNGEFLIVLGAGLNGEIPSLSLQTRLLRAAQFLEDHPHATAILSGGQGPGETIPEALAMQRDLLARGVEPARLLLEQESRNTYQNLLYSGRLLERELGRAPDKVVILSNGFHLFRAQFLAERLGFEVDTVGAPLPRRLPFLRLNCYVREYFAVIKSFFLDR